MVLTQAQSAAALEHVITVVLDRGDQATMGIRHALNQLGIHGILDLLNMGEDTIKGLQYSVPNEANPRDLPMGDKKVLELFLIFVDERENKGNPIKDLEWVFLQRDEFIEFCMQTIVGIDDPNRLRMRKKTSTFPSTKPSCSKDGGTTEGVRRGSSLREWMRFLP